MVLKPPPLGSRVQHRGAKMNIATASNPQLQAAFGFQFPPWVHAFNVASLC